MCCSMLLLLLLLLLLLCFVLLLVVVVAVAIVVHADVFVFLFLYQCEGSGTCDGAVCVRALAHNRFGHGHGHWRLGHRIPATYSAPDDYVNRLPRQATEQGTGSSGDARHTVFGTGTAHALVGGPTPQGHIWLKGGGADFRTA